MLLNEFYAGLAQYRVEHPTERYGQAVFNYAVGLGGEIKAAAVEMCDTNSDPYYANNNSARFISKLPFA